MKAKISFVMIVCSTMKDIRKFTVEGVEEIKRLKDLRKWLMESISQYKFRIKILDRAIKRLEKK
jgi:hypothetical protein